MGFSLPLLDFRERYGPLNLRMPVDPWPSQTDFRYALANFLYAPREDSQDALQTDGTWGPKAVGAESGTGVVLGHSTDDLDAVLVAAGAVRRREQFYDWEHWLRQIRYCIAAWEMTHDPYWRDEIIFYDDLARATFTDHPAAYNPDLWGNSRPFTLTQFFKMAMARPHVALPWNLRAVGEIAYGHAMRLKVDPGYDTTWAETLLATCRMAAVPQTGQLCADDGNGAYSRPVQYNFQWGLGLHGILALIHQTQRGVPAWIFNGMRAIRNLPRLEYYGYQSPVAFVYSEGGRLLPYEGPQQHGDPGFAYWSSNCVALHKITGDRRWRSRAAEIGPTTANSEDERKSSMLLRGLVG